MGDSGWYLIADDPLQRPSFSRIMEARQRAIELFPDANIDVQLYSRPEVFVGMEAMGGITCPRCGSRSDSVCAPRGETPEGVISWDWFFDAYSFYWEGGSQSLLARTPCCGAELPVWEVQTEGAGISSFAIEIGNSWEWVTEEHAEILGEVLGCALSPVPYHL